MQYVARVSHYLNRTEGLYNIPTVTGSRNLSSPFDCYCLLVLILDHHDFNVIFNLVSIYLITGFGVVTANVVIRNQRIFVKSIDWIMLRLHIDLIHSFFFVLPFLRLSISPSPPPSQYIWNGNVWSKECNWFIWSSKQVEERNKKIVRGWFAKSILRQQWPEKSNKWEEFQEGQRDKCQISFVRSFFFLSFFCFSFFFFFFFVCFTFLCCHHFFSVPEDEDEGKEEHDEAECTQNQFLSGGTFIFSKKICKNKSV